jgi:hypothetical protein
VRERERERKRERGSVHLQHGLRHSYNRQIQGGLVDENSLTWQSTVATAYPSLEISMSVI